MGSEEAEWLEQKLS